MTQVLPAKGKGSHRSSQPWKGQGEGLTAHCRAPIHTEICSSPACGAGDKEPRAWGPRGDTAELQKVTVGWGNKDF